MCGTARLSSTPRTGLTSQNDFPGSRRRQRVVACDAAGAPDFRALHGGNYAQTDLCVWAFDLLEIDGQDIRQMPLILRRVKLGKLIRGYDHDALRYSEPFTNADKLLEECAKRGLEGIVCKEKGGAYWSGTKCGWIKVKTAQWREANMDRGELFNTKKSPRVSPTSTSGTGAAAKASGAKSRRVGK
jgi:bifunctional non-homologous end joining protein LigD